MCWDIEAALAPALPSLPMLSIFTAPIISLSASHRRNRSSDNARIPGGSACPCPNPKVFVTISESPPRSNPQARHYHTHRRSYPCAPSRCAGGGACRGGAGARASRASSAASPVCRGRGRLSPGRWWSPRRCARPAQRRFCRLSARATGAPPGSCVGPRNAALGRRAASVGGRRASSPRGGAAPRNRGVQAGVPARHMLRCASLYTGDLSHPILRAISLMPTSCRRMHTMPPRSSMPRCR